MGPRGVPIGMAPLSTSRPTAPVTDSRVSPVMQVGSMREGRSSTAKRREAAAPAALASVAFAKVAERGGAMPNMTMIGMNMPWVRVGVRVRVRPREEGRCRP